MTLTAPATRKIRGFKAGFTIQTSTPPAPAAAVIGTIVVLDNYILTVPVSSVPEDADYAELLWSDTENGTYTSYQSSIPALVTTNVSVDTVIAATKWFKVKTINAYGNTLSAATSATSSAGSSATPNQMVNLRVTSKTTTSLTYAWDALANVTSYTLQRWNGSDWTTAQVTGITDTTHTANTLTANTEYGARGRGVNTGAASPNGPLSAETWDFTDAITTPVPTPPTITWQRISSTVIRFLFANGDDATSWEGFSRSPSGSGSYSSPITLTVDVASYDLTVAINETADFYITATNAQGSENSDIATGSAAGSAYTVLFSNDLKTNHTGLSYWSQSKVSIEASDGGWTKLLYDTSAIVALEYIFDRTDYQDYWIAFDILHGGPNTSGNAKTYKLHGAANAAGNSSNVTFHGDYGGRSWNGFQYGNAAVSNNDNSNYIRTWGAKGDARSTAAVVSPYMAGSLLGTTYWRRFWIRIKLNSNLTTGSSVTPDGVFELWVADDLVTPVLQLKAINLYNRGDEHIGMMRTTIGDYCNLAAAGANASNYFYIGYRNLVVAINGMPP